MIIFKLNILYVRQKRKKKNNPLYKNKKVPEKLNKTLGLKNVCKKCTR